MSKPTRGRRTDSFPPQPVAAEVTAPAALVTPPQHKAMSKDPHDDPELEAIAAEHAAGIHFIPGRVEWFNLDDVELHPANANEGDVGVIDDSIDTIGFYGMVNVQSAASSPSGKPRMLTGEHRLRAIAGKGGTRIRCWVMDVDDDTALRILEVDNRSTRLGRARPDQTIANLEQLKASERGLAGTGYDGDDLEMLREDAARDLAAALATRPAEELRGPMHPEATCPQCGCQFRLGGVP